MVQGDETGRERKRRPVDLSKLPDLVSLEVRMARFDEPRVTYERGDRIEHHRAVAFEVTTTADFVQRALGPVLFVGDARLNDWERQGEGRYVFYGYEPERYEAGAPIGLGWPDEPEPRVKSEFRYSAPNARK